MQDITALFRLVPAQDIVSRTSARARVVIALLCLVLEEFDYSDYTDGAAAFHIGVHHQVHNMAGTDVRDARLLLDFAEGNTQSNEEEGDDDADNEREGQRRTESEDITGQDGANIGQRRSSVLNEPLNLQ